MQILAICINMCNMLAWCCEMQALGSEMLVLGSDMLSQVQGLTPCFARRESLPTQQTIYDALLLYRACNHAAQ